MTRRERNQSRKGTKRALTGSILAIVLCVVLLAGATFAWFTDTASTKVSNIQAGTLKVDIVDTNGDSVQGEPLNFKTADNRTTEILWEPGATYELPAVQVINKGNLALKYKVVFTAAEGDQSLAEVLEIGQIVQVEGVETFVSTSNTLADALNPTNRDGSEDTDGFAHGKLAAKDDTDGRDKSGLMTFALRMKTTAGNEYQGKSITGLTISVLATQDTVEVDSYGKDYDAGATYATAVTNEAELKAALAAGKDVVLTRKIVVNGDNQTLDLNGKSVTVTGNCGLLIYGDNVTVKNGTIQRPDGVDYSYGLMIKGVGTVIDGVTIDSGINVSGYANDVDNQLKSGVSAEIKNCNITVDGTAAYYTVCVQGNATATLSDSTVTKNNTGSANYYFWVEEEFTEDGETVGSSSLILRNVTKNSNCSAEEYNPSGVAPTTQP